MKLSHDLNLKLHYKRKWHSVTDPTASLAETTLKARPELKTLIWNQERCIQATDFLQDPNKAIFTLHVSISHVPSGTNNTAQLCGVLLEYIYTHICVYLMSQFNLQHLSINEKCKATASK